MPCHEEHCQHSLKLYGIRADDVHTWIDQPSRKWQGSHRQFRHDTEAVKLAGDVFGNKYGRELAQNIALDHIMADHEEELKQENESIVMKCANCGGQLVEQNGKISCKYCKYETLIPTLTHEALESIKLPAKTKACFMYMRSPRKNETAVLPKVLPPIYLEAGGKTAIDDIYREFSDKNEVLMRLSDLGYRATCVQDLRVSYQLTDSEIKELLYESRKVTLDQLKDILKYAGYSEFINPSDLEPYRHPFPGRILAAFFAMVVPAIVSLAAYAITELAGFLLLCFVLIFSGFLGAFGLIVRYKSKHSREMIRVKGRVYLRRRALEVPEWMRKKTEEPLKTEEQADKLELKAD